MRKKLPYIFLAIIIFIQICVPVGMITYQKFDSNLAEAKGEKFRFHIDHLSYSPQGKLYFDVDTRDMEWEWEQTYAEIEIDEDSFAKLVLKDKKPRINYYIRSSDPYYFTFPISEIDTDSYVYLYGMDFQKDYSDYDYNTPFGYYKEAYLEAYVYKGRVGSPKIYIDGMEAYEYLAILDEQIRQGNMN